ncbi:hypothetical protein GCM10023185_34100 [Hymenobacter saemangeumensis]|uniref:Lipoprotein n=1 Tax=Hymenobacter saemangeumensis TaxID=1084522 RepID=A0ABP8INQ7_9BACT
MFPLTEKTLSIARPLSLLTGLFVATSSCASFQDEAARPQGVSSSQDSQAGLVWSSGSLSSGTLVAPANLRHLPGVNDATGGGGLTGPQFWKSNNPEALTGEGWMMTNGNNAPQRGGTATPLTGPVALYLSHLNYSGQTNNLGQPTTSRSIYVHLIASNPSPTPITITGRGKMIANNLWRFRQTDPSLKSSWYLCSEAWLNADLTQVSVTIQPYKAVEIAKVLLPAKPANGDAYTTEGRYELDVAGGGAFFSSVATFDGSLTRAITFGTGSTGQQATSIKGEPKIVIDESGENYGREAGIASHATYYSGDVNISLPATTSHMGLCFNTNNRKPVATGSTVYYQDQSAPYTMRLQSSTRTWAGYGHKYSAKLILSNPNSTPRNVRISLGANPINDLGASTVLFDSPVQTYLNGVLSTSQLHQVILYNNQYSTSPRGPQRQSLRTVAVPANGTVTVNVLCYVPGLGFGAGLQLDLESGI